jgi:hypothetical protein
MLTFASMNPSRLRRAAIGLAAAVMVWPAAAHAASVSGPAAHDPATTFTVNGATVTVSSTNRHLLRAFQGHDVVVLCEAGIAFLSPDVESDQPLPMPVNFSIVGNRAAWPAGATAITVALPQDVSDRVDLCAIGLDSVDSSQETVAAFTQDGRDSLSEDETSTAEEQAGADATDLLMAALKAAGHGAFPGPSHRWGRARAVAHDIRARRPKLKVRVVHTLRGARRENVVYVIARGTGGRRLTLAVRDATGKLHVLRWRKGGPTVS